MIQPCGHFGKRIKKSVVNPSLVSESGDLTATGLQSDICRGGGASKMEIHGRVNAILNSIKAGR